MKHLAVLEHAGLVVTHRQGRSKLHYLNPVPIGEIHDRWITKYAGRPPRRWSTCAVASSATPPDPTEEPPMTAPRHVFQTHIRATPEAVWEALTDPEFTRRYFHHTAVDSSWERGAGFRMVLPDGNDAIEGVVEEVDPPHRLVVTWHVLYDAELAAEPPGRVEWLIAGGDDGVTRVTTIHRDLALSPKTSEEVGYGWTWVLDSLKSILETGEPLPGRALDAPVDTGVSDDAEGERHRRLGIDAFNSTWELLGRDDLSDDEADDMLERAYTSAHHWRRAARRGPENAARGSWLLSRVHAVLGHGDAALHHADRCAAHVAGAGLTDFDLAYAHEARARALACLGRLDEAASELAAARDVPIADDEDRAILEADLAAAPWYGLVVPTPA